MAQRNPRYDVLFNPVPIGPVTAPNRFYQTPHATGMGARSREEFVGLFKAFAGDPIETVPESNTPMPWTAFARMTEDDLGAIYDHLRTVAPVDHAVSSRAGAARETG